MLRRTFCLLVALVLFITASGGVNAFGTWEAANAPYESLEEAIFRLEVDIQRAAEGQSASPAFLEALEAHVNHLYSILAELKDSGDYPGDQETAAPTVGSARTYAVRDTEFAMRLAPAATFPIGGSDRDSAAVNNAFWIAETPVTYGLWYIVRQWALNSGYTFANPGREGSHGSIGETPRSPHALPVTEISWRDALVWTNALSEMQGFNPVYTYGGSILRDATNAAACDGATADLTDGFRLASMLEWELAARYQGTDDSSEAVAMDGWYWTPGNYASGASDSYANASATQEVAWYRANSDSAQEVARKRANGLGLYDMSGNVPEWTFSADVSVQRISGGGWNSNASGLPVGRRVRVPTDRVDNEVGLRLARTHF